MLLNTVTGPNTKLKAYFIFCRSPVSGNRTFNSVFYKWEVKVFWSQKSGWEDTKGSYFLRRKESLLTKDLITWFAKWYWCFLWQRQENNKLVGSLESTKQLWVLLESHLPNFHAKIDSTITKYIGHNFTKVTTFIIIIIKN